MDHSDALQLAVELVRADEVVEHNRRTLLRYLKQNVERITDPWVKDKIKRGYGRDLNNAKILEQVDAIYDQLVLLALKKNMEPK